MQRRKIKRYGYIPDLRDHRDLVFTSAMAFQLPKAIDLRPLCPPVRNQTTLGACTGKAIANAFDFERGRQGQPFIRPSSMFIYFQEREMEGTINFDAGAQIRDGIKAIANLGVCPETLWPFNPARFTERPPKEAYAAALENQALLYRRIGPRLWDMKACLAAGLPFVFGFSVPESFESDAMAKTGIMAMPGPDESIIGGHAVLCVGYRDETQMFIVQNSWGDWGDKGYCYMPYAFLDSDRFCDDRWVISKVEQ